MSVIMREREKGSYFKKYLKFPLAIREMTARLSVNLLNHSYQKRRGPKQPLCGLSWSPYVSQMLCDDMKETLLSRSL